MTYIQAMVLGLIQGLTEFLPVSSSGHLIFVPTILGWADQGVAFDLMMHGGTLAAVVIYFRKKLWQLICAVFSRGSEQASHRRLGWFIALSAIPAAIVGLLLETNERNPVLVGANLIFWGLVLGLADYFSRKNFKLKRSNVIDTTKSSFDNFNNDSTSKRSIIAMSFAQILALIPGTSRSGITMTAGLFSGLGRKDAAEISFLMSVPITTLAGLAAFYELLQTNFNGVAFGVLLTGFFVAFLSGLLAINGLLKIVERWSFTPFVVYRVLVGVFILWYLS